MFTAGNPREHQICCDHFREGPRKFSLTILLKDIIQRVAKWAATSSFCAGLCCRTPEHAAAVCQGNDQRITMMILDKVHHRNSVRLHTRAWLRHSQRGQYWQDFAPDHPTTFQSTHWWCCDNIFFSKARTLSSPVTDSWGGTGRSILRVQKGMENWQETGPPIYLGPHQKIHNMTWWFDGTKGFFFNVRDSIPADEIQTPGNR